MKWSCLVVIFTFMELTSATFSKGGGHGGGHGGGYGGGSLGSGTACIVKGSYCQCHYCKCEHGNVKCKGHGSGGGYGKFQLNIVS